MTRMVMRIAYVVAYVTLCLCFFMILSLSSTPKAEALTPSPVSQSGPIDQIFFPDVPAPSPWVSCKLIVLDIRQCRNGVWTGGRAAFRYDSKCREDWEELLETYTELYEGGPCPSIVCPEGMQYIPLIYCACDGSGGSMRVYVRAYTRYCICGGPAGQPLPPAPPLGPGHPIPFTGFVPGYQYCDATDPLGNPIVSDCPLPECSIVNRLFVDCVNVPPQCQLLSCCVNSTTPSCGCLAPKCENETRSSNPCN
jgi:hypothetical protein